MILGLILGGVWGSPGRPFWLYFSARQLWLPKWLPGGTGTPPGLSGPQISRILNCFFHVFGIHFLYVFLWFWLFCFIFLWILANICGVATDFLEANSSRALLKKCIAVSALSEVHVSPPICSSQYPRTHIVDVASLRQGPWALSLVCSSLCTMITRRLHVRIC